MWSNNLLTAAFIIILLYNNLTEASVKRWKLEFYSLTCEKNSTTIKQFDCNFNKLATSHYSFSVRLMFSKTLDKQFFIRYYIHVQSRLKKTALHFIDIKLNACDAVRTNYEIPLLQSIILELRRASNIPYQCPFKKDFLYELKNISVTDKYLSAKSLPSLNFTNGIELYEANKLIGTFFNTGGIVAKT